MKQFNMPIIQILDKPFNLATFKKRYEFDPNDFDLIDIVNISFDQGALVIKFRYNDIDGEVEFPTEVNALSPCDPDDIWWVKQEALRSALKDYNTMDAIEQIMYIIADETFRVNGMYEE